MSEVNLYTPHQAPTPPQGVLVRGHAGRVINKLSQAGLVQPLSALTLNTRRATPPAGGTGGADHRNTPPATSSAPPVPPPFVTPQVNPKPQSPKLEPSTLNPQPSTPNPQPSTLNPQPSTLDLQP